MLDDVATMLNQKLLNPDQKEPNYQYSKAQYHPIEEYVISSIDRLTSDTPSFVLEVTWPRVALFYHPASSLCIQLRDRYVAVAREIRRRSIRAPVEFWAVSCEVHRDACEDLGVNAVPRILAFPAGKIEGVLIPRTSKNDIELGNIVKILGIAIKDLDEEETLKKEELEEESAQLRENEESAKDSKDPHLMDIGEADHMREILHPHSDLSDVFSDAMVSLLHSIDSSIDKDVQGNTMPWSWDRFHSFREWLDLMHWSLPTREMAMVHHIVNDLRSHYDSIEDSPDVITRVLASHDYYKKESKWSKSCSDGHDEDHGYSCGFWKLLHIVSMGVVEQHQSVLGDLQRVLVPHVATTIRDYIENFGFAQNNDGKKLIIDAFQDCMKDKQCQQKLGIKSNTIFSRFRRRNIPAKTDKCWKGLSFLLWQVHQDYRAKKLSSAGDGADPPSEVEDTNWPRVSQCPSCYLTKHKPSRLEDNTRTDDKESNDSRNDINWNLDVVFEQLKHKYWPRALQTPRVVVLDRWDTTQLDTLHPGAGYIGSPVTLIFILVASGLAFCFFCTSQRQKFRFARDKREGSENRFPSHTYETYIGNSTASQVKSFQPRRRNNGRVRTGYGISAGPFLDD